MDFLNVNKFSKLVTPPRTTTNIPHLAENEQTVTFTQTTASWSTAWSYSANTAVTQTPPTPLTTLTPAVASMFVVPDQVESSSFSNIFTVPAKSTSSNLSSFDSNENTTDYFSFMDPSEQLNEMGFNTYSDEDDPPYIETREDLGLDQQPQAHLQSQVPLQSLALELPAHRGLHGVGPIATLAEPQHPAQDYQYHGHTAEPEVPLQTQATEHNGPLAEPHAPVTAKKSLPEAGPLEHVCEDCGKSYSKPNKLKEHKLSHNPLCCQYCNLKYKSYSALRYFFLFIVKCKLYIFNLQVTHDFSP